MEIKNISNQNLLVGECPTWCEENQCLYWCCLEDSLVFQLKNNNVNCLSSEHQGPICLNHDNKIIIASNNKIILLSDNGENIAINLFSNDGINQINFNDICADSEGRLFGGPAPYSDENDYETGFLFRIEANGLTTIVDEGFHLTNGMGFSPDNSSFYCIDSAQRCLYEYDYQQNNGGISNRKILKKFKPEDGVPDGMCVDKDGFIWVALWTGCGIIRLTPDGEIERFIPMPIANCSSCCFGGKDLQTLFVTTAAFNTRSQLDPPDHNYDIPRGGSLYKIDDLASIPVGLERYKGKFNYNI